MSQIQSIEEILERIRRRELIEFAKLGAPPISPKVDEEAERLAVAVTDLNDELVRGRVENS